MARYKLPAQAGLALAGFAYFQAFSQLPVNPILKNFLILLPIQLAAIAYISYVYYTKSAER
ncbi:MAG: hypothetical protein F6J97_21885 [Leptolyngbya sp. SIO4C1]|nr:hypothetical protein [Leptolyngbya sp. SIO4C1]